MSVTPSPNGDNGRGTGGRFAKGNAGGPGNPHARRVSEIRARLLASVTDADLEAIIGTVIAKAKAGEPWAVKELLSRLIGDERISMPDLPTMSYADSLGLSDPVK